MDTLLWLKLNKNIKLERTLKRFYGKYNYKVKLYAPCFRLAAHLPTITVGSIRYKLYKIRAAHNSMHNSIWHESRYIEHASPTQLMYLITTLASHADKLSIRVENPYLTIFANDGELLFDIVSNMPSNTLTKQDNILEFWYPLEETISDLENDIIFVKTPPAYKFKITTREGSFSEPERTALLNYINILGDEVSTTMHFRNQLKAKPRLITTWVSSSHILTNDNNIPLMIKMIAPRFILKINELKVLPR